MNFPTVTINTKFLNSLQPEWLKYVTHVRLAKKLTVDSFDDLFDYLQQFKKLVNASRAKKLEKSHDPLALVANTGSSSRQTSSYYVTHPTSMVDYDDEYQQDDVHNNSEDLLVSAMLLLAKAITQNFSNPTNNRLRALSNTRNQAIIQGDSVNIQSRNSGHYARNCPKPRVRDSKYFMEQMLLAKHDEAGVILTDEQNDFLFADASRMEEIKEISVNICLMARIQPANHTSDDGPSCESAFINEVRILESINKDNNYLNEFLEADERAKRYNKQAQSQLVRDRDIIRDLEKQRDKLDLDVKNYKRKNEELQKTHSILKRQMSEKEDTYHDTILDLEAKLKKNVDLILKLGNSLQGMFMLGPKPLSVYDQQLKHGLGYPNPYTLKQAISKCPKLYVASSLGNLEIPLNVRDSEDTLEDAFKSQQKMTEKMNDPIAVANKQNCWTINYKKLNALYKDFVPQKELSVEQKYFPSSSIPSVKIPGLKEMKDVFESTESKLDELEKQNDLLRDQLLEASLKHDVELVNATSRVRRPMSKDSSVTNSVLVNSKKAAKNVSVYVRKNKQKDNTSANVISNKENVIDVDVANASKAKTLLCVSCMQNVLIPCHDKCLAKHKLNVRSNVHRTFSTNSRTPKSLETTYVAPKTRFSKKETQSKTLDTTSVVSKSKIDVESALKVKDKVVQIVLWVVVQIVLWVVDIVVSLLCCKAYDGFKAYDGSQPTQSTHRTHRTTSVPRSPNLDKEAAKSSAPRRSIMIRLLILERRSICLTPPAPVPTVDKADEMILQDTLQVSLAEHKSHEEQEARENVALVDEHLASEEIEKIVDGQENIIDDSSIPRNDEPNIPGTRIEPRSNKESPEVEITKDKEVEITKETPVVEITNVVILVNVNDDDEEITDEVYELKRRDKGKLVEETRNSPIPTPIRSPQIHTNLVSLDIKKLQELTDTPHTTSSSSSPHKKFMPRKSFDTLADNLHDVMFETLPTMVYKHITEQVMKQVPEQVQYQVLVYVAEGLILERQKAKEETKRLIAKAILQERGNIQAQISTQIKNAIANVIPSQVDASDDPHDDAHPEGENSAKRHKTSEYEAYVSGESLSGQVFQKEQAPSTSGNLEQDDDFDF
ncbi:hypothetical protein Tco_0228762 [Tanacetum coccineum]